MVQKLPLGIAAALLLAFVALSATPARNVDAQDANVVVKAGGGETGYAVNAFLPGSVTIMEGQSVTWTVPWYEPHSIVFVPEGAPLPTEASPPGTEWPNDDPGYVYSTLIFGDPANPPSFGPIVFPEAGDYTYFCEIHPLMTGTVHVVASGDVDTQAEIDARAEAEYAPRLASIKQVAADLGAAGATITPRADGTSLYELVVGGVNDAGDDAQQFFPPAVNVKVGDTVKWVTSIGTPHTITFNAPPGPPQGDPFAIPRTENTTFDGNGFTHSGILTVAPEEGVYTSYELTFTATGSFTYICILHAPQGMMGTVNVAAATTPTPTATATPTQTTAPSPPATGTGTSGTDSTPIWLLAIAGLVVMAAGGSVVFAARR